MMTAEQHQKWRAMVDKLEEARLGIVGTALAHVGMVRAGEEEAGAAMDDLGREVDAYRAASIEIEAFEAECHGAPMAVAGA